MQRHVCCCLLFGRRALQLAFSVLFFLSPHQPTRLSTQLASKKSAGCCSSC